MRSLHTLKSVDPAEDKNRRPLMSDFDYIISLIEERTERNHRLIEDRNELYESRFKSVQVVIDERDRLYLSNFKAAETAVSAALAAAEKAVNAAFMASEKAVLKAEQAQKEYNERSNEFRGQLDDQAKTLMPRPETLTMFRALEEKLIAVQTVADARFASQQASSKSELDSAKSNFQKSVDGIESQVASLREFRGGSDGRNSAQLGFTQQKQWSTGIWVGIVIGLMALLTALVEGLTRHP
jgi:hypothetical protein